MQVNLGFFLTALMVSRTIDWLNGQIARYEEVSVDEILAMAIPEEVTLGPRKVLEVWRENERTGACDLVSILTECDPVTFERINTAIGEMCLFVFFHEMSHWVQSVFKHEAWAGELDRTLQHLRNWCAMPRDPGISPALWQFATNALASPPVRRAWAEEIQCDLSSLQSCLYAFGGRSEKAIDRRRGIQRTYVGQAMVYSLMLELQELYAIAGKVQMTFQTHPPAYLRRRLVGYIDAKELRLPQAEYESTFCGSGTFVYWIGTRIIDAVRKSIMGW